MLASWCEAFRGRVPAFRNRTGLWLRTFWRAIRRAGGCAQGRCGRIRTGPWGGENPGCAPQKPAEPVWAAGQADPVRLGLSGIGRQWGLPGVSFDRRSRGESSRRQTKKAGDAASCRDRISVAEMKAARRAGVHGPSGRRRQLQGQETPAASVTASRHPRLAPSRVAAPHCRIRRLGYRAGPGRDGGGARGHLLSKSLYEHARGATGPRRNVIAAHTPSPVAFRRCPFWAPPSPPEAPPDR